MYILPPTDFVNHNAAADYSRCVSENIQMFSRDVVLTNNLNPLIRFFLMVNLR